MRKSDGDVAFDTAKINDIAKTLVAIRHEIIFVIMFASLNYREIER